MPSKKTRSMYTVWLKKGARDIDFRECKQIMYEQPEKPSSEGRE